MKKSGPYWQENTISEGLLEEEKEKTERRKEYNKRAATE